MSGILEADVSAVSAVIRFLFFLFCFFNDNFLSILIIICGSLGGFLFRQGGIVGTKQENEQSSHHSNQNDHGSFGNDAANARIVMEEFLEKER